MSTVSQASQTGRDPAATGAEPGGDCPASASAPPSLAPFLSGLQLADSFFPSGLYTLSNGLESYAQAGLLTAAALPRLLAGLLRHGVGPADATALVLTHRATAAGDLAVIAAVDRRLTAVKIAREPRQASIRLGRQLLALARDVFACEPAGAYLRRVRAEDLPGNQAVALGLLKAALDIPAREAVAGELYSFAASGAGAALRMSLIDHRQAQWVIHQLHPVIAEVTDAALGRPLGELGGSTPLAEIMSMRHEVADLRLFVT